MFDGSIEMAEGIDNDIDEDSRVLRLVDLLTHYQFDVDTHSSLRSRCSTVGRAYSIQGSTILSRRKPPGNVSIPPDSETKSKSFFWTMLVSWRCH